ncbi:MAG TPA: hypothetical protein VHN78_06715 [Chloroflexota bacterium]|nr:hypothetical protein [Chloroflexota bacterium]
MTPRQVLQSALQTAARALFGDEARDDPASSLPDGQDHLRELDERLAYLAGSLRRYS